MDDDEELAQLRASARYKPRAAPAVIAPVTPPAPTPAAPAAFDPPREARGSREIEAQEWDPEEVEEAVAEEMELTGFGKKKRPEGDKEAAHVKNYRSEEDLEPTDPRLPVGYEANVPAHSKSVSCLSLDPAGSRMVTGSRNGEMKYFDFNGMQSNCKSFREFEPVEGYIVESLAFNNRGGQVLCCLSDRHGRIFSREGETTPLLRTARGDMYIRDLLQTKGHTAPLTHGIWDPVTAEQFMTSSVDGSVRIWNTETKEIAQGMEMFTPCSHVLKILDKRNACVGGGKCSVQGGVWPIRLTVEPSSKMIVAGCNDGSLQIFYNKPRYLKPDKIIRTAHDGQVSAMLFVNDNTLATRGGTTAKLWDIRQMKKGPTRTWEDLPSEDTFLPRMAENGGILACGGNFEKTGIVTFLDTANGEKIKTINLPTRVGEIAWPKNLNQVVVALYDGSVKMLYDVEKSTKGALFFVGRNPSKRREADEAMHNPIIFNASTREGLREMRMAQDGDLKKHRKRERKDNQKTIVPERPLGERTIGTGGQGNSVVTFVEKFLTDYERANNPSIANPVGDIQKFLLTNNNPDPNDTIINSAYAKSGQNILDFSEATITNAEKNITGKKICPMCGKKMCSCGHMERERKLQKTLDARDVTG